MRMRSYTLHLPIDARPGESIGLDRAVLVPDGFAWPSFAFGVLWFLFHRLWIAALIVLAGFLALAGIGHLLGLPAGIATLVTLLTSWLVGLEASSLRRWTLARLGWPARDAVIAATPEEAEARALNRWLDSSAAAPRAPFPAGPTRRTEPVIGLFPAQEIAR
ncbi:MULTISPECIES: DUF2628 domain-containing protein [unclassified Methylobacterium]|uniref:DUF2628 domain-containing protein n=1 Tax=unclassified Methylobacterium TaxID=2615210 RepID=UPI0011C1F17D|nr:MULTISPECIES: DUF2628 domain-containing protein [unclassified Methylobacterium]QEE39783.1 DUF2628 domain-containing protein [Methylobacterium sp. WL1]TXN58713.1 DUF2628 domain-containing protein [Methylobacterium sp. WL2]